MSASAHNIAIIGASGLLGSRIAQALLSSGHRVTAIQRKESSKNLPAGVDSVKANLNDESELRAAFEGQDVVLSAVGFPIFETEKVWIDAALAVSVKRIIPSEFTTNLESPLASRLPVAAEKVKVRQYLTTKIASTTSTTTWTSLNNGAFFDLTLRFGALGPNPMTGKAVFHNGGDNEIGPSTLSDIATAIVRIVDKDNFEATANQAVYIHSAAVTERKLTAIVSRITGFDFGTVEDGSIPDLKVANLLEETDAKLKNGDKSAMLNYYYAMMYEEGYGGKDFRQLSWNDRLGIRVMNDQQLEEAIRSFI
ncbi:hypothetical protein ASPWEDRAFT_134962 [Aspergillus wentii DTO 134E9]|uniref:NmrA-like domain-containing protein n=1 Tax=Aspergillus wentii DTO 134E9 TaxID=1073089 RepID=A0A1L9RMU3_ASPWE|nr:uncharacterized protein ASPWEDRAFT_134962 [Aspergillus wentii DTO 134E9]KAI9929338.1 hypothetical protein MW887_000806 [Aspergillus wentii]OJJ36224.1 hypothetical protein ASPWEDRAFT_134962 [Aspergillus wentii DTO 134E9]